MPDIIPLAACLTLVLTSGCVARTLVDVATLPVRAASKTVDLATTSQDEADRNRGREMRRQDERLARAERALRRHEADCENGDGSACARADAAAAEIDRLGRAP
jgi:hypothetical protein